MVLVSAQRKDCQGIREQVMVGSTVEVEHQLRHGDPCKDGVISQPDQPRSLPSQEHVPYLV